MNGVNFYAEDANQGESIWPFINFCVFLAGIIVMVYGIINFISVWREFRLYYDAGAVEEKPDMTSKKKQMIKYGIITGVGLVVTIATFFV